MSFLMFDTSYRGAAFPQSIVVEAHHVVGVYLYGDQVQIELDTGRIFDVKGEYEAVIMRWREALTQPNFFSFPGDWHFEQKED